MPTFISTLNNKLSNNITINTITGSNNPTTNYNGITNFVSDPLNIIYFKTSNVLYVNEIANNKILSIWKLPTNIS